VSQEAQAKSDPVEVENQLVAASSMGWRRPADPEGYDPAYSNDPAMLVEASISH
jgi:hypothetical protein